MHKICLALFSLCILGSCSDTGKNSTSIKVSGEGKIRIKPDIVILTIDVSFVNPRMAEAVRQSQLTVDSVVAILSEFGNAQNDIKTSSITANKHYNYDRGRNEFIGYRAEQSIDFVLTDIKKFTDLTAKLLTTKINSISQVQFGHSKADSLLREADLLAYDDALKSAHKLCERANVNLGKLLYLTNTGEIESDPAIYSNMGAINTFNKSYGGAGFKISPEVLVFSRKVVSEYEIGK